MRNCWGIAEYLSIANIIILAATAVIIYWYTRETHKLREVTEKAREESEKAREIEFHPWLGGSNLTVDPTGSPNQSIWLPVTNEGKTPALNVSFDSDFYYVGKRIFSASYKNTFIAPNDTAVFLITRLNAATNQLKDVRISVTISYSTHMKGSGTIKQGFQCLAGGWSNKESEYTFILSTGEKYPR